MRRIENSYLYFINSDNIVDGYSISNYTESAGMVEFILDRDGGIPMVLNKEGFFWATKQDEDGNNLYEKFPYKVEKLDWKIEYVNDED